MYNAESIEKWNRNGEVSNTIPDGGVAVAASAAACLNFHSTPPLVILI